jgi:hypothetical protein
MPAHKIEARVFLLVGRETVELQQFVASGLYREARVRVNGYFTNMR